MPRRQAGHPPFIVGIEDPDDIIADIDEAIERVTNVEHTLDRLASSSSTAGNRFRSWNSRYEAYGEFDGDNAVLVCHALTGSDHVAGRDRVDAPIRPAPGGTISLAPARPSTQRVLRRLRERPGVVLRNDRARLARSRRRTLRYRLPAGHSQGLDRAQRACLTNSGRHLHAVVGGSVGGMNALEWVRRYPDDVDRLVPSPRPGVSTAVSRTRRHRPPFDYDRPELERRRLLRQDDEPPSDGLALARQLGHVMYLSKASMERRFGRRAAGRDAVRTFPTDAAGAFFPYRDVESYLDYNAEKFTERFDANSYLYLTRAMDNYDLAAGFESDADALAAFDGDALVMSFTADWHFTTEQAEALADSLRRPTRTSPTTSSTPTTATTRSSSNQTTLGRRSRTSLTRASTVTPSPTPLSRIVRRAISHPSRTHIRRYQRPSERL